MKTAKYILIGFITIVVIALIAAIFLPKKYNVQVQREVSTAPSYIYYLITNMDNRSQWDEAMENAVLRTNGYDFAEENKARLNLYNLQKTTTIQYAKINEDRDTAYLGQISLAENNASTLVSQSEIRFSSWPANLLNFIWKWKAKSELDDQLGQISQLAVERSDKNIYFGYQVIEDVIKDKNFLIKRDTVHRNAVQQFYLQNLGVLYNQANNAGLTMDGMPCGLFFSENEENIDIASAIPVVEEVNIADAEALLIPTQRGVVVDYYGDFNETQMAHKAVRSFLQDRGMAYKFPYIEQYVTDPSEEKDPSKWLTRIIYYIAD